MEGQTSAQPRGTNQPPQKQGFCPTMRIILAALQCWSCWERAAQPLSASESVRKDGPGSGDLLTPRSYLRICNTPPSRGNEFTWSQEHHHNPHWYFSIAAVTQSSSNPHLSVHLGRGKSLTHLDVDLL